MKANPKSLILDLLLAAGDSPITVRDGILACSVFGISENSLRVTLARLTASGLLVPAGRGAYRLGPDAKDLASDVSTWRTAEQRLRSWRGGYIVVHSAMLGRSDRAAMRRRERAFQMLGFRELDRDFHVRPDNIDTVNGVRQRLYKLGLDPEAAVFLADHFDPARDARARGLWNGQELTKQYKILAAELEEWLLHANELDLHTAARESFFLGKRAIRHIVFDPLLPEPFVDVDERRAYIKTVLRFDRAGRAIWGRFVTSLAGETSLLRTA